MAITIHIISLKYDIYFDDADSGPSWAGDGSKLVKILQDRKAAEDFCAELNPVIRGAEKENIVVPKQPNNKILKEKLGFDLHDLEQGNGGYHLHIESYELKE